MHRYESPASAGTLRTMYDGSMYLTVTSRFVPARVLWCFHFTDTTRVHLTMTWVLSFSISSEFGRDSDTASAPLK